MTRDAHHFLALDLGAESGRGEVVTLQGSKVTMREVHRFPNRRVKLADTIYWDFPFLFAEILAALRACRHEGVELSGLSVDTWGVDFGLLDRDGRLLSNPVSYRDARTDNIHAYSTRFMSNEEIFALTGYEPWQISSLFQLLSLQRDRSPLLESAGAFLNMPDLFHYFLTGRQGSELSIVNTSNLLGVDLKWCEPVVKKFSLPRGMLKELIAPATVLGPLGAEVRSQTELGEVPVIATCGHDTSAVAAAVPGEGRNWAFISCGTWSILCALIDQPVATPQCLKMGFTNEYTIGSWYIARNISGLWLLQELRRKWDQPSDRWDYSRMTAEAAKAPSGPLVDVADDALRAPADMEEALLAVLRKNHQQDPASKGALVRCVLESLALEYALRLEAMGALTKTKYESLYLVGGGTANKLLCQFTADACDMPVEVGVDQCTSLGNALGQALALGILEDRQEIRHVVRESFGLTTYRPSGEGAWAEKRRRYTEFRATP